MPINSRSLPYTPSLGPVLFSVAGVALGLRSICALRRRVLVSVQSGFNEVVIAPTPSPVSRDLTEASRFPRLGISDSRPRDPGFGGASGAVSQSGGDRGRDGQTRSRNGLLRNRARGSERTAPSVR